MPSRTRRTSVTSSPGRSWPGRWQSPAVAPDLLLGKDSRPRPDTADGGGPGSTGSDGDDTEGGPGGGPGRGPDRPDEPSAGPGADPVPAGFAGRVTLTV